MLWTLSTPQHSPQLHRDVQSPRLLQQHPNPSYWEVIRIPLHPIEELCIPPSTTQQLPGLQEPSPSPAQSSQHLETTNPTLSSTGKASHNQTVGCPWCLLPSCLLNASSLCSRRLFLPVQPLKWVRTSSPRTHQCLPAPPSQESASLLLLL